MRSPPTRRLSSSAVPRAITTPPVDDRDPVREPLRLLHVLGGEQQRRPSRDELVDDLPQLQPGPRVQTGGGFVQEQHGWLRHERTGEVEPAPHAAGVALDRTVPRLDQVELFEQLTCPLAAAFDAQMIEAADHFEILEAGEVFVDRGVLARGADARTQRACIGDDVESRYGGPALVRHEQGGEHPHRGRLAGAVGPEQRRHRPFRDSQIDSVEGRDRSVPLDQPLGDYGVGHESSPSSDVRPSVLQTSDRFRAVFPARQMPASNRS